MKIYNRILQNSIKPLLYKGKAIVVTGARQVGKTTMLQNMIGTNIPVLWLNADENRVRERLINPSAGKIENLIGNNKLVVIDEIQRIRDAGLLLKIMVDNFKEVQFIATGSSALEISETIFEPLTGRHFLFHLYPFSLAELYPDLSNFEIEDKLRFHLIYGCYPEVCLKREISEIILTNLSQQYLYKDVLIWKDIRKPQLLDKLLRLLAYQIGSEVSVNELANTLQVKSETVDSYIDLLEKSFVIYRLKSYSQNLRKEVSKKSKIFFWDNGIRNSVIEDFNDLELRNDKGALFENFIISERIKMNQWLRPGVKSYFWRNFSKSEVDYVELSGNNLSAYEFKWKSGKHKISRSFTTAYPLATTQIITPENSAQFVKLEL